MTSTKEEQIQAVYDLKAGYTLGHADIAILKWLARIALAGMEAEPVGVTDKSEIECLKRGEMANVMPPDYKGCDSGDSVYLYDAPQPLTTSERSELENYRNAQQVVTEQINSITAVEPDWSDPTNREPGIWAYGWNECRAAMQSGAVKDGIPAKKLDVGENCWSCGMYFTYKQHSECDGYCPHCDSPVDLDDEEDHSSKVVPMEPTEEMISNAWREATGKCNHETIRRIYATMLAAAPKQEAE